MKEYVLKVKDGDTINIVKASSYDDAVTTFAQLKNLTPKQLLDIFTVKTIS